MRVFKPNKLGVIVYNDKEYKVKTDNTTISIVMLSCINQLDQAKSKSMELKEMLDSKEIEIDKFIDEIQVAFDEIYRQCERFCSICLGTKAYSEINKDKELPLEDLNELSNLIMQELIDIKDKSSLKLKESVAERE